MKRIHSIKTAHWLRILALGLALPCCGIAATMIFLEVDPGQTPKLILTGDSGQQLRLEASADLENWETLAELTLGESAEIVSDTSHSSDSFRFYRAVDLSGAEPTGSAIYPAVQTLLASLSDTQKANLLFEFENATQRKNWSNLPTGIYQRDGARMGDMTESQRDAVWALLAAVLSDEGYTKVKGIVDGDEVLRQTGGGGNLMFGDDEYYVSILGTPSFSDVWMLQFGGHHLAVNATIKGNETVLTPSLPCVQPASYTLNGVTVRPLGDEVDKAYALMQTLDAAQRAEAIIGSQYRDLVLGAGQDGRTIAPEGVQVSTFTAEQKALLLDLAGEWIRMAHGDAAATKMAEVASTVDDTWFAWSGPTTEGSAYYFRIQGPTFIMEVAPQGMGGNATNHLHCIYRDPTNDYGVKLW